MICSPQITVNLCPRASTRPPGREAIPAAKSKSVDGSRSSGSTGSGGSLAQGSRVAGVSLSLRGQSPGVKGRHPLFVVPQIEGISATGDDSGNGITFPIDRRKPVGEHLSEGRGAPPHMEGLKVSIPSGRAMRPSSASPTKPVDLLEAEGARATGRGPLGRSRASSPLFSASVRERQIRVRGRRGVGLRPAWLHLRRAASPVEPGAESPRGLRTRNGSGRIGGLLDKAMETRFNDRFTVRRNR
jgi:hypothetical protein